MASGDRAAKRCGGITHLKPEKYEEYKEQHQHVWPGVMKTIYECNIRNYSIFYDKKNSLLFSYFEYIGDDFEADVKKMAANPDTQRWWKTYGDVQLEPFDHDWSKSLPSETGAFFSPLEDLFHCGHSATSYK